MLWFQTRRSKSSFLFPFLSRVWVLSGHIIGSAWFLFHWRALGKVQTVIYSVSPIPRLAPLSFQPPTPPNVKYQLCDRRAQTAAPVQESPGPGETRGGREEYSPTLSLLYRALQHWFDIKEQRQQWHLRWLPRVLRELAFGGVFCNHPLTVPAWPSPCLAFSIQLFSSATSPAVWHIFP